MSLIWKMGLIIVSTSQGGCEGLDELMRVKSLIASCVAAAKHRVRALCHCLLYPRHYQSPGQGRKL